MPIDLLIFHNFSPPFMTHIISHSPRPHLPHRGARKKRVGINQGINNSPRPRGSKQTLTTTFGKEESHFKIQTQHNTNRLQRIPLKPNHVSKTLASNSGAKANTTAPSIATIQETERLLLHATNDLPTKSNERKHAKYHPHPSHTPASPYSKMWSILFASQFFFSERLRHISEITSVTHNPDATLHKRHTRANTNGFF
jgi:hypothetical protein